MSRKMNPLAAALALAIAPALLLSACGDSKTKPAAKGSGVSALAWDASGGRLAFGCADGQAGLLTLPG